MKISSAMSLRHHNLLCCFHGNQSLSLFYWLGCTKCCLPSLGKNSSSLFQICETVWCMWVWLCQRIACACMWLIMSRYVFEGPSIQMYDPSAQYGAINYTVGTERCWILTDWLAAVPRCPNSPHAGEVVPGQHTFTPVSILWSDWLKQHLMSTCCWAYMSQ